MRHDTPPLEDVLEPGLSVVFCGTAAGAVSAARGAPYAGPGNKFWRTLHELGFTPVLLRPEEFRRLPEFGIGLTDVNKYESGSDRDLTPDGFDVAGFEQRIAAADPNWVAFNGKKAAQTAHGAPVEYGEQSWRVGSSRVFVLPSTSGAASGFWDVAYWRDLADHLRGG
jgi:TDG/mug DNA glycosylase family protein